MSRFFSEIPVGGVNEEWMDALMDERREELYIPLTAMMECRPDSF